METPLEHNKAGGGTTDLFVSGELREGGELAGDLGHEGGGDLGRERWGIRETADKRLVFTFEGLEGLVLFIVGLDRAYY
jgi:hypothetical protein